MSKWLVCTMMVLALVVFLEIPTVQAKSFSPVSTIGSGIGAGGGIVGASFSSPNALGIRRVRHPLPPAQWNPFWARGRRRRLRAKSRTRGRGKRRKISKYILDLEPKDPSPRRKEDVLSISHAPKSQAISLSKGCAGNTDPALKEWVAKELEGVKMGDARLNRRLGILVTQLCEHPNESIPQACGTWKDTKAAYRFFDNGKVQHGQIIQGHRQASVDRIRNEEVVLSLQDTTSLDYTHHPSTQGMGHLDNPKCKGLLVHTSIAVSTAGVPLGLLDQQVWARDPSTVGKKHQRKKLRIEEKESFKWLQGLRASREDLPAHVCMVTVADREADVFDFFLEAEKQGTDILVRAAYDRCLKDSSYHLWDELAHAPLAGQFTIEVGRAKDRLPRKATVEVRFCPVTIQPPQHRSKEPGLQPVSFYAVEVREQDPPPKQKPLHWLLLSSLPVDSLEDAKRCVRWYTLRWLVERYHYVLKSGCRIEERELQTADRLKRCLAVFAIVAWRLLWLTYQSRVHPDNPCTVALETHEWQALYCYIHKTSTVPDEPPSLNQALRWIAQLGGFLNRKGDGQPGVKVLWRGWQRLHDIAQMYLLIRSPPDVGNA